MSRLVNENVLSKIQGVIHIGANIGQERDYYAKYDLNVLWIEPNLDAFQELQTNIANFSKQKAYHALMTDQDNALHILHITSGKGQCSSIFEWAMHKHYYPEIDYVRDMEIASIKLDTFIAREDIDLDLFQFLVLDTEAADLLVLKGATNTLSKLQFVEVETSPLELRKDGCLENQVIDFLALHGFRETERIPANNINNHILFERIQ